MRITQLFFDPEGRVRSGWRFVIFVLGFIFATAALLTFTTSISLAIEATGVSRPFLYHLLFNLVVLVSALLVGWLSNRFLDGLPFRSLGASFTAGWLKHLALGLVIGALTICLAVGIAAAFGGLAFAGDEMDFGSISRTLWQSLVIFMLAAAWEEALFRGYPMQTFIRSNLTWFGILFMAVMFATTHVDNPRADTLSWINTFLAGIWFAAAYLKTRSLWFPFGMHLMWNWMQGAFFGIEVSGLTDITSAPLLKEIDRGPAWLTGEAYGIEAGVACTAALIVSTVVIFLLPDRKSS